MELSYIFGLVSTIYIGYAAKGWGRGISPDLADVGEGRGGNVHILPTHKILCAVGKLS